MGMTNKCNGTSMEHPCFGYILHIIFSNIPVHYSRISSCQQDHVFGYTMQTGDIKKKSYKIEGLS